ncbi:MAG: lipoprotein-releasing system ATP-binding protein [Rickettsiales bacterium]|jgi:lipoprotein-releasing system ATP-binding protein
MGNLILKNINKSFLFNQQKISVVKNANLAIDKGESVALVGPSGAGKTTFLQIAGLLDNPDSGQILIDGVDASNANDLVRTNLRKNHIGFIYQSHHLLPEFSALENVAMPLLIQGLDKKSSFKRAEEILEQIGLKDRLYHLPSELSGGQQQRVAVARAIAPKPSLLLADEPTGNLDSMNAENVFGLIIEFSKKFQISSLIVTHNMDLAKKLDRIVTIKDGILI